MLARNPRLPAEARTALAPLESLPPDPISQPPPACRESDGANAENAPLTLVLLDWNQAGERGIPKKFVQMQKTC